jgi:hypothetical protein
MVRIFSINLIKIEKHISHNDFFSRTVSMCGKPPIWLRRKLPASFFWEGDKCPMHFGWPCKLRTMLWKFCYFSCIILRKHTFMFRITSLSRTTIPLHSIMPRCLPASSPLPLPQQWRVWYVASGTARG